MSQIRLRARVVIALAAAAGLVILGVPAQADLNTSAKLRQAVTPQGVMRHMQAFDAIAQANNGNRFAGLSGHAASAQYVIDQLRGAGYSPTVQEFEYLAFYENSPAQLQQVSPNAATYTNGVEFRVMTYSGSGDVTASVSAVDANSANSGCEADDFSGFTAGDIALMQRGTCPFRQKVNNATAAGAAGALIFNNIPGSLSGTLGAAEGLSAIPALGLTQSFGQELVATSGSSDLVMHMVTDTGVDELMTYNVFAESRKGDPNNVVMAGAHLDSVTAGPGINDNGSGSAAVLESAIQLAKTETRNKLRFAWWSAEESGLVGSNYYVDNLTQAQKDQIALYLNFDMVGSPNFVRFVYDGDNSAGGGSVGPEGSAAIEQMFVDYFSSVGLASAPTPFNGRSDYGRFIANGIPAGGLFTGAEGIKTAEQAAVYGGTAGVAYDACYHAQCDTIANVNVTAIDQMSDAIAHSIITYAQSTASVNGAKGKGNMRTSSSGAGNGTGSGGGGGLHDDHDEVAI